MERTIAIYHEGATAHYTVAQQQDGTFKAHLLQYSGSKTNTPPRVLDLQKNGGHWGQTENTYDNLVEELGAIIRMQRRVFEPAVYRSSNREY